MEPIGAIEGSGFEERQWLVRRGQQFVQVTDLLYHIVESATGDQSLEEIAVRVTASTDWAVSADHVRRLIERKLIPLGLVQMDGGTESGTIGTVKDGPSLGSPLQVNARRRVVGPGIIDPATAVLQWLFWPPIVVMLLTAVTIGHVWLYFGQGPAASVSDVLMRPGLFLGVVGVLLLAAVFHEFGHASALRYGGGRATEMGAGLYLVFPALYTNVSDSYRLGRRARVRTDLGGPYFHLVFSLFVFAGYYLIREPFLLLVVILIDLEILRQFLPFVRLDGYWVLSDLTGIPDLFSHVGPFLRHAFKRGADRGNAVRLKRGARLVFAAYLVLAIIVLPFLFVLTVAHIPRILELVGRSFDRQAHMLRDSFDGNDVVGLFSAAIQILILTIQLVGIGYFLFAVVWKPTRGIWQWSTVQRHVTAIRVRAGLLVTLAGILLMVGSLFPWLTFGAFLSGTLAGISRAGGRVVLACGIALLMCGPVIALASGRSARGTASAIAILGAVVAGILAQRHIVEARHRIEDSVRASFEQTGGRAPSQATVRGVIHELAQLGITIAPGYGSWVALGGGVLGFSAAAAAVSASRFGRASLLEESGAQSPNRPED